MGIPFQSGVVCHIAKARKELDNLNKKREIMVQRVKIAKKEKDGLKESKNEAKGYMLNRLPFARMGYR